MDEERIDETIENILNKIDEILNVINNGTTAMVDFQLSAVVKNLADSAYQLAGIESDDGYSNT